jgi:hypothetical protein
VRSVIALLAASLALATLACSAGEDGAEPKGAGRFVEAGGLPRSGGCGDAFLWAATKDGDLAVTVQVDAVRRPTDQSAQWSVDLPSDDVLVRVLRGVNLPQNFCTDLILEESEPASATRVLDGRLQLTLDPAPTEPVVCGTSSVSGHLRVSGLRAEDGTEFGPFAVATESIGCTSG